MSTHHRRGPGAYHFIVLPNTGLQICRGFPVATHTKVSVEELWQLASKEAQQWFDHDVVRLIREHVACNPELEATDWIAASQNDFVFFRVTRAGTEVSLDLVIDTQQGAGAQPTNLIEVALQNGFSIFKKRHVLAAFYVEEHVRAKNEAGSLIMDFGNSGSAFIFSRAGAGPLQSRIVNADNPFDPRYRDRSEDDRNILKSNMIVLRVADGTESAPWIVLGPRAEELIQSHPLASFLYAPKKYVRNWPPHLLAAEPTMKYRGILGQRPGLHPMLDFVRFTLDQMFQHVMASLTNPHFTSDEPEFYPQLSRIMLTYPLTWRESDRRLFRDMVDASARRLFHMDAAEAEAFQVELICSEPVAVAAYVLWETFFHFGSQNLQLASSFLGNTEGTNELRLLVVDIGGGSTDVACVDVQWRVQDEDQSVDVTFKMLESMRFNRAGDRLSHVLATAIVQFIEEKYGVKEPLDFRIEAKNPAFVRSYKRQAVSRISELSEECKAHLSKNSTPWVLDAENEYELVRCFEPLLQGVSLTEKAKTAPRMTVSKEVLRGWLMNDRQSLETNGEPGLMDVFLYLDELKTSLESQARRPHLAVLSGRSTRLPFIKEQAIRALGMPPHRVRTIDDLLPDSLKLQGHRNMDKLAVVCGAQRFRFGDHVRFSALPDEPIFNRYIGTVRETPSGLMLNKILIRPGDTKPRTLEVRVEPSRDLRIGNAFREDGLVQVIANLSNTSHTQAQDVVLDVLDDTTAQMQPNDAVWFSEWVPGGTDIIVDNFNDTGRIDGEPEGLIRRMISAAGPKDQWIRSTPNA